MASPALVAATCVMGFLALLAVFARGKLVKRTHEGLAALRYVATFESDVFVRCNDALAKHFLSGGTKSLLSWFVPRYYLKYGEWNASLFVIVIRLRVEMTMVL